MLLTKTFFPNSAIFIEKKWAENRLQGKSAFLWGEKKCIIYSCEVLFWRLMAEETCQVAEVQTKQSRHPCSWAALSVLHGSVHCTVYNHVIHSHFMSKIPCAYFAYWWHDLQKLQILHMICICFNSFCMFFILESYNWTCSILVRPAAYFLHIFCIFCKLFCIFFIFFCIFFAFFLHIFCMSRA